MEILKFSPTPQRNRRSASAKRSGLMPMVSFGIAVLVLGGMSTTLAGTISLNSGGSVEFGQGVVTTAACDTSMTVTPSSIYDTSTATFSVNKVTLADIGAYSGTDGSGCKGKYFKITAYDSATALNITPTGQSAQSFVYIQLPSGSETTTVSNSSNYTTKTTGLTIDSVSGQWGTTQSTGSAAGSVVIGGLKFSGTVVRITVESSDSVPS